MKKLLALALAFTITTTTFAGNEQPVPTKIVNKLNTDFKVEGDVKWKSTEDWFKASFVSNNQIVDAFYSPQGKFIGVSRLISPSQLPMMLNREVEQKGKTATISNLFEMYTDRGTEYFITYKNGDKEENYKGTSFGWERM